VDEAETDLVNVPVPRRHLVKVYGFIAELEASANGQQRGSEPLGDPTDVWTDELIRQAFEESNPAVRAILKYLAQRPGDPVPTGELVELLKQHGYKPARPDTLSGVIGAFGRRVTTRYGLKGSRGNAILPFQNPRDRKLDSRVYIMSKRIAEVVMSL